MAPLVLVFFGPMNERWRQNLRLGAWQVVLIRNIIYVSTGRVLITFKFFSSSLFCNNTTEDWMAIQSGGAHINRWSCEFLPEFWFTQKCVSLATNRPSNADEMHNMLMEVLGRSLAWLDGATGILDIIIYNRGLFYFERFRDTGDVNID